MEGYSVTEAASVLGVPTERVWELLARGVLSGVPDGETGMRVFLQPRPAPTAVEEPRRPNGGGSTHEREPEASPFRELLSEFRNLTERYGQALLALGEARGEVASLRSRVDLLEARFDLRLPMSGPMAAPAPSAAGWGQPTVRPMPERHAAADPAPSDEPSADAELEAEASPRRRRRRGQHRATDDFAEALARAEDPSPAELPGGAEAAAAFAALRDQASAGVREPDEAALPRELPAAEPMAVEAEPDASPEPSPAAAVVFEPTAEADSTAPEDAALDEVGSATDAVATPSPELVTAEPDIQEAPAAGAMLPGEKVPSEEPEPEPERDAEASAGPEASVEAPIPWDRDRYTATIEEPDWIPEERSAPEPSFVPAPELAAEPQPEPHAVAEQRPEPQADAGQQAEAQRPAAGPTGPGPELPSPGPEPVSWDADAVQVPSAEGVGPDEETPTGEETMLWFGREPNRAATAWPAEDDFAAEMEVSTGGIGGSPWVGDEPVTFDAEAEPEAEAPAAVHHATGEQRFVTPPHLVRSQPLTSPASRAYRRLRRIFPS